MVECFHREREDGYCWRCEGERTKERYASLLESVPSPRLEEALKESESDSEPEH